MQLSIIINSLICFKCNRAGKAAECKEPLVMDRDEKKQAKDERQDAEEKLREAELLYHTLFNQSPDGILIIDTNGNFIDFNEAAHRQLGYSREEFERLRISDIDPFQSPEEVQASIKKVMDNGSTEFEVKHRTKGGEIRDVFVITQVMSLSGRTVFHTIWRDITERKHAEKSLNESIKRAEEEKAKTEAIIAAIGDGISIEDTDFKIIYQNQVIKDLVGDHIGELCYKAYHRIDQVCEGCQVALCFKDGKVRTVERDTVTDKGIIHVENTASPLRDSTGKIIAGVEVIRNITSRKKAEEEREKLILELQDALAKIKTLSGMLPICASCKKIRDDKGYWSQIEAYISEHSEAEFSHGVCPECAKKLYPEYYKKRE
jgi:PAS domain S-box-containing protein